MNNNIVIEEIIEDINMAHDITTNVHEKLKMAEPNLLILSDTKALDNLKNALKELKDLREIIMETIYAE